MIKIKRTIFAAAIIIFALAFGAAALYIIDDTKTSITCIINDIERSVENKNYNKAHELSNKLNETGRAERRF